MEGKTAFDAPRDRLDAQEIHVLDKIKEHGWFANNVFADEEGPGFSYTMGFWHSLGVPDLITFSLPPETANAIFFDLYDTLKDGRRLNIGVPEYGLIQNDVPLIFLPVDPARFEDHLTWTRWFHAGTPGDALQMVWQTKNGQWPWTPEIREEMAGVQHDMTPGDWLGVVER